MSRSDREYPRYAHEAAVKIRTGGGAVEGRTRNVSRGGLCATVADALPVGSEVELEMVLVFDSDLQSDALRMPARIVWCTELDEAHQIGVVFRPLDARRAEQIALFLSFLDEHAEVAQPRAATVDDRFR